MSIKPSTSPDVGANPNEKSLAWLVDCSYFRRMRCAFFLLAWIVSAAVCLAQVTPIDRTHAHNDYLHQRPLLDALDHGFCSVEADIHLVNGELLIGHDPEDLVPERTLEKLYLKPLEERVKKNGGQVYRDTPGVILLIDIKTEAEATWAVLSDLLKNYQAMLTRFKGDEIQRKAVTVILSGNRPREILLNTRERLAGFDGRLADLGSELPVSFMPLVSDNWQKNFSWRGEGEFPPEERTKLRALVRRAHAEDREIRFWATPDQPDAWAILLEAGVDWINTDKLEELAAFLKAAQGKASKGTP